MPIAPVLVHDAEWVYLCDACDFTGMSVDTIRRWCRKYLIARPSRGNVPLKIHKPALAMLMHDDFEAIELLRTSRYGDDRVKRYYDFAGVPLPVSLLKPQWDMPMRDVGEYQACGRAEE